MIDPASIPVNPKPPPVVIESVLVDRAPIAFEQAGGIVRLGPDATGLEIAYTGLSFLNAGNIGVRFRFKLEGLEPRVARWGTRRTAYYPHVPAGDYVFRVTAANSDGVWNDTGQTLSIIVTPPFYRRAWFLLLMLTMVMGAAIVWHHRRLSRMRAAHAAQAEFSRRLLASQEHERQRIAGELHDSLGQQLLVTRNRAMLGESVADDLARSRGQFDEIVTSATAAIGEVRTIAHNLPVLCIWIVWARRRRSRRWSKPWRAPPGCSSPRTSSRSTGCSRRTRDDLLSHHPGERQQHRQARGGDEGLCGDLARAWRPPDHRARQWARPGGSAARPGRGLGLTSITERLRMLGGSQTIDSAPGQGTAPEMQVPLSRRASSGGVPQD